MVFKSLFSRKEDAPEPKLGPLGLSIGRAVDIDFSTLRVAADDLVIAPPDSDSFIITGYGIADLGGGSQAHRFYDDDNVMLQFLCEHGLDEQSVREITYFTPWQSHVPSSEEEWSEWTGPGGRIGAPSFSADGYDFDRLWDAQTDGHVTPIAFTEAITTDEGDYEIYQQVMLYTREAGFVREYLLMGAEAIVEEGADAGSIEFLAGYDLNLADVKVV